MDKLIDLDSYPVNIVLPALLKDKTTGKNIICCNLWQMDGLTDSVPQGGKVEEGHQYSFFETEGEPDVNPIQCKIKDRRGGKTVIYRELKATK